MSLDLAALVQTAIHAIPDGIKGTCTITRKSAPQLDYVNDERVGDVDQSFTAPFVAVPMKKNEYDRKIGLIDKVDFTRELLIAAKDCAWDPLPGMMCTVAGVDWRIVGVETLNTTMTVPQMWTIQLGA
jgi:hypothetical protein